MSPPTTKLKLGISACLLGEPVRFNGGHKQSQLCMETLAEYFDFVPVCPEVAIGLGTPRAPIRLVGDPHSPQARGSRDADLDVTRSLAEFGDHMAEKLTDISGYIFMHKSPSCGLERVKVYQDNGHPAPGGGRGIYASHFCKRLPNLPVEDEGRLHDPVLRENFLTRVFAYGRWQQLQVEGLSHKALTDFHARYKYQLMATNPQAVKKLGQLIAAANPDSLEALGQQYFGELMQTLKRCATRGTHSNALQHISGYLKQVLSADERQEIQQLIDQYRTGIVPLVVPLTLLKHHFRQHPDRYIDQQAYLQPHPEKLGLRNAL